jgi:hypothetical protein
VRARPAGPAPAAQAWPPLPGQVEDDQPPGVDEFDDPAEVGALAAAFAADYLSWDEADPDRRGAALARYLPRGNPADPSLLGWSGKGRQRAEFALPGSVRGVGREVVLVDVRVRVTPYRPLGAAPNGGPGRAEPRVPGAPLAAAPAPTARGWQGLASRWVRLDVPIKRDRGRLVVDGSDERLAAAGGEAAP